MHGGSGTARIQSVGGSLRLSCAAGSKPMARRGRGRKFRRYLKGKMDHKLQLATLANQSVLGSLIADTVQDTAWVSSVKAIYSIAHVTPAPELGPLICGWAHSDYTDAEVEEWLESANSWKEGDMQAQEKSRRRIWQIGTFAIMPTSINEVVALNQGRLLTTKLGVRLMEGQTLRFWVYNAGGVAFATTDPEVRVQGHANIWPQ